MATPKPRLSEEETTTFAGTCERGREKGRERGGEEGEEGGEGKGRPPQCQGLLEIHRSVQAEKEICREIWTVW